MFGAMIRIIRGRCFYFTCFISIFVLVLVFTSKKSKELTPTLLHLSQRDISVAQSRVDDESFATTTAVPEALAAEPSQEEEDPAEDHRSLTLRDMLRCDDTYLDTRFEYYGNFVVVSNYVKRSKEFRCHETITLSAPGDFRFLDNIEPLVDRWRGPISVALYAPGYDFHSTIRSIAFLRQCKSELIKEYVSFHLFFEHDHFPNESEPLVTAYKDEFDCSEKPPYETVKDEELYKSHNGLTYPINLARNIAKTNVQTHFVFPSDIELYPTRDFIPKFMDMIFRNPQYVVRGTRNVFVLPIFEVVDKVPESKTELVSMLRDESAILFHKKMCALCHRVPKDKEWEKAEVTDDLNVFTTGKRHGRFAVWEPFFVCTQKEPLWDDRFNWEGQSNKMVQAYHMCMQDYNFLILDNAFLTHKPGVKKKKVQVLKYQDQIGKNTHYLEELAIELPKIYGENENCQVKWGSSKNKKKSKDFKVHEYFKQQQERRQKMLKDKEIKVQEEHNEKSQEKHVNENVPEEEEIKEVQEEEEKRELEGEADEAQNKEIQDNELVDVEEEKREVPEEEEQVAQQEEEEDKELKENEDENQQAQLEQRNENPPDKAEISEEDDEGQHEEDLHQNEQAQQEEEKDKKPKLADELKQKESINDDQLKKNKKEDEIPEKYDDEK